MERRTPIITLLTGFVIGVGLWVASMAAASPLPAGPGGAAAGPSATAAATPPASSTGSAPAATTPAGTTPAGTGSAGTGTATPASSAAPSPTASFVVPPHANYTGQVMGNQGSIAIVVHDTSAIAYFCNGAAIEAWMSGVPRHGKLSLTGKTGAHAEVDYALGHARGTVTVNGVGYLFSVIAVHKPSGLFQSIATVRGAKVKAGWIVLADGTEVGSIESNPDATHPSATKAPALDVAALTADVGGTTITAVPIDAETGTGF